MTENLVNNGCPQRDSAEHEGYAETSRSFNRIWKERDSAQPKLLEAILHKDNFNRAYKRVKANKGTPGIDGMTVEEANHVSKIWETDAYYALQGMSAGNGFLVYGDSNKKLHIIK